MLKKYNVKFSNRNEIRMGSPYFYANLELVGLNINLPNLTWQDKFAVSNNNEFLVLVSFNLENNEPGFRFNIINTESKKIIQTENIQGLLNSLRINGNTIQYNKFEYDKIKAKAGQKDFNYNEELKF